MFKKVLLLLVASCSFYAMASDLQMVSQPLLFSGDMDQHGSFIAKDLQTSPLLRSMFNLSVNDVNSELVRICLNPQNQCRVIKRDSRVNLVVSKGRTHFDDQSS